MENESNRILANMVRLQRVATKLEKLVESQQAASQEQEFETLEAILRQKQRLIQELMGYGKLRASIEHGRALKDSQDDSELLTAMQQLESTINTISCREQTTIRTMQLRLIELGQELLALTSHRQATEYYCQSVHTPIKGSIDISS